MAIFKNTTLHPIKIMVNGNRKTIKPGTIIHGPESLSTIPGLSIIDKTLKTIIPRNSNICPKNPPEKITKRIDIPKFIDKGNTDITSLVNNELQHLEEFRSMGQNPSVTIAILTKDSYTLIKQCCESILKNVKYENVTILIADTGTKNKTVFDYYKSLKNKCKNKNIGYKLVLLNSFHFSKNYNEVINNHVNTDFVIIQNNDTVAINDYITKMIQTISFSHVGSVGCRMYYPNNKIQHDGQLIFDKNGKLLNPGHLHLGVLKNHLPQTENIIKLVDGNTAAGVLVKTSDFKKVGGFDENYMDIFQDVDLMLKFTNKLGMFNYCNRKAELTHIDNASRFLNGVDITRITQMHADTAYLRNKVNIQKWTNHRPKKYDISIITLVNDIQEYRNLAESLKKQNGQHKVEIITIPNFYNLYTSIPQALNNAIDVCNGKYIIMMHQDVIVPPDWLNKIRNHIQHLDVERIQWGIIGPAGVTLNNEGHFYLLNKSMKKINEHNTPRIEVFALDELCLIMNNNNNIRFSEDKIDSFHFYGGDICVKARKKGLRNFAIDAYCFHNSIDGRKNLKTKDSYEKFVEQAKKFHIMCKENGISHWRTTTSMGLNEQILFCLPPPDYEGDECYIIKVY